jgi:hypothetical protein
MIDWPIALILALVAFLLGIIFAVLLEDPPKEDDLFADDEE